MPSTLIGVDPEGLITQWNKEAEKSFGISAKRANRRAIEIVLPHLKDEMISVKKAIGNKEKQLGIRRSRIKDKNLLYEDISIFPLIANGIDGAVIRIDDVTVQVRIDEMMVQSEKMLSIGGLAAGMAHEINNPLAGMMAKRLSDNTIPANIKAAEKAGITIDGLQEYMLERGIMHMLSAINESGKRAAEIIDNMLSFSRKGDTNYSSHDPVALLNKILELAATDFDLKKQYDFKNIRIIKEFEDDMPTIPCIKSQIQQVILNILRNGAESMSEIEDTDKQPQFIIRLKKEKKMIRIEIEDNGPGMDKKTSNRIFEPFYTTKPVGIGTGLGLSVSFFIIHENHKGLLEVQSEPGRGANFIIRLPESR